jgi:hypothetical protein
MGIMIHQSKGALVLLGLSAALAAMGQAQTITCVQIHVPDIRQSKPGDTVDAARYVRSLSDLTAAVLETNTIALERPVDFVVLTGNSDSLPDDPTAAASAVAGPLAAVDINTIILAFDSGSSALSGSWRPAFARQLSAELPNKTIWDIHEQVIEVKGVKIGAFRAEAMKSSDLSRRNAELDRIQSDLAFGRSTILFASSSAPPDKVISGALWPLTGPYQVKWEELENDRRLIAVFVDQSRNALDVHPSASPLTPVQDSGFKRHIFYGLPSIGAPDSAPESSRGILLIALNGEGLIETRPIALSNRFDEEGRDLHGTLLQASLSEGDGDYENSYKLYGEALKSKDAGIRNAAEAGLRRVNGDLQEPWERWKRKSVVLDWIGSRWVDLCLGLALAILLSGRIAVRYFGRASPRFSMPVKLSQEAPAELFLLCVYRQMKEIRDTWRDAKTPLKSERDLDISLAPDASNEVLEGLPKLIGETSTSTLKLIFFFWRYFAWRVESSVYGNEENAAVYVKLCWGWSTKASWIIPSAGEESTGIRECATEIAYNISSGDVIKR